jgi:hypothetical protein
VRERVCVCVCEGVGDGDGVPLRDCEGVVVQVTLGVPVALGVSEPVDERVCVCV